MADERDQIAETYELAKLHAGTDGAFDEKLMEHWFASCWDLCAQFVGLSPPQQIEEPICIDDNGNFRLSYWPKSTVEIYAGYSLVATFPPSLKRTRCDPALCCYCDNLKARYWIGATTCEVPPRFQQAVCRLFAYTVENRGDSELDREVLAKCGALSFLSPDLCYVL